MHKDNDQDTLGIQLIHGKHPELGSGMFISDIRPESEAMKVVCMRDEIAGRNLRFKFSFHQVGLKVGDKILAINGDETDVMQYEDVSSSNSISLTLQRKKIRILI